MICLIIDRTSEGYLEVKDEDRCRIGTIGTDGGNEYFYENDEGERHDAGYSPNDALVALLRHSGALVIGGDGASLEPAAVDTF